MQYGELTESLHVIAMTEPGETTCHSRADITAAGGAGVGKGELKRSNPSPLLGAANVGESERSLLHWELPGEAQLVLCS